MKSAYLFFVNLRQCLCGLIIALLLVGEGRARAESPDETWPFYQELPFQQEMSQIANPYPALLARLVATKSRNFYGTAILFKADSDRYLFITNAHVLPRDRQEWSDLRLVSPIKHYESKAFSVVALSPAYDLAVLAMKREAKDLGDLPSLLRLLDDSFYQGELPRAPMQIALAGFPGYPSFNERVLLAMRANFLDDDLRLAAGEKRYPSKELSFPIVIKADGDCPIPFMKRCYHVPFISWGFSGGALLGLSSAQGPRVKILGMVSHFAPLSDQTHVIPMAQALALADSWLAHWQGQTLLITDDESGLFRATEAGQIEILKGPLAGTTVSSPEASVAGGYESGQGGHESVGGGGSGDVLYGPALGYVAFIDQWREMVSAIVSPEHWGEFGNAWGRVVQRLWPFRGALALLHYRPGVMVKEGEKSRWYQGMGGEPITHLQNFLRRYAENDRSGLSLSLAEQDLPTTLTLRRDTRRGYHSFVNLVRFKTPEQLGIMVARGELRNNPPGFTMPELAPLLGIHASAGGKADLIIGLGNEWTGSGVTEAMMATREGRTTIDTVAMSGHLTISFAGSPIPQGPNLYRYAGPAHIVTQDRTGIVGKPYQTNGFIAVTVQRLSHEYELKALLVHTKSLESDVTGAPISSDEIVVDGVYVPFD